MVKNKFLLTSVAIISLVTIQSVSAETLNEAVIFASNNHPTIRASLAAENAAHQSIVEEKSAYYPTASANASFGRLYADNTTTRGLTVTRGAGYSWFGEGGGQLNQRVYDWSARKLAVKSAVAQYESLKATKTGDKQAIAIEATTAYLQLLRAKQMLNEALLYKGEMGEYFDRINTSFNNGGSDESEVSRAQDLVSLASNLVVQFEGDVMIAEADYREIVGRLPTTELTMPQPDIALLPNDSAAAVKLALSLNAQINAAAYQKQASDFAYQEEKKNLLPTLDAELSVLKRDQDDIVGGETEDARALLRANWEYSFGGAQKAAQRRMAMQAEESAYNYESVQRSIERDVEVSWVTMKMAGLQKNNQYDRLNAAQKTLDTYAEQYEGGQQTLLENMSAKAALFNARQDYLNAYYQELNSIYTVMGIIGMPFYENNIIAQSKVDDQAK